MQRAMMRAAALIDAGEGQPFERVGDLLQMALGEMEILGRGLQILHVPAAAEWCAGRCRLREDANAMPVGSASPFRNEKTVARSLLGGLANLRYLAATLR